MISVHLNNGCKVVSTHKDLPPIMEMDDATRVAQNLLSEDSSTRSFELQRPPKQDAWKEKVVVLSSIFREISPAILARVTTSSKEASAEAPPTRRISSVRELKRWIPAIEKQLGYQFQNKKLLIQSCIGHSFKATHCSARGDNETLEFLGDKVLGLVVSEQLYRMFPKVSDGELTVLVGYITSNRNWIRLLDQLKLGNYLLLPESMKVEKDSKMFADFFEAIMGAVYLDGSRSQGNGLKAVSDVFFHNFSGDFETWIQEAKSQWRYQQLQKIAEKLFKTRVIDYCVTSSMTKDRSTTFHVSAMLCDAEIGTGEGTTQKEAEYKATEVALKLLGQKAHIKPRLFLEKENPPDKK